MDTESLRDLIAQPEGEELEFKSSVPDPKRLSTILSAFANTNGGHLIIGVEEPGQIVGVRDPHLARSRIEQALKHISPALRPRIEIIPLDGKPLIVVTIPKGDKVPYLTAGQIFQRTGDQIRPLASQTLYSRIVSRGHPLDQQIQHLSEVIEILNIELVAMRSWKTKIRDWVTGALIGYIISELIALARGLRSFP